MERLRDFLKTLLPSLWGKKSILSPKAELGLQGEKVARRYLQRLGMRFLAKNVRTRRGEIDLVFRDRDCLVFVEVKTRSSEDLFRPAAAVTYRKRRALRHAAFDYLQMIGSPPIKVRFDIVEVVIRNGHITEIRHLPNAIVLSYP